jgi:6-phosphofructokinase 1
MISMKIKKKNAFYAQSGGVTSVINASACGVIESARKHKKYINKLYAGKNGILGALNQDLIDTSYESKSAIAKLKYTPGGIFGSCRYKLEDYKKSEADYDKLIKVFKAHDIGYFFYNGGGDSQDTTNKISEYCSKKGLDIQCIGIPKTVDNDLPLTDCSPGFGSVGKYTAISTLEAGLDVKSMCATSTKVFILEVMGRHAGWIAASSALASDSKQNPPHVILFPEVIFNEKIFLNKVKETVSKFGYCVVVASEGAKNKNGKFLADSGLKDAFGHSQLGGVAPYLSELIKKKSGYKCHWAVADYLQRSARHIASKTDVEQAYALGSYAVDLAVSGKNAVMTSIKRVSDKPYKWKLKTVPLKKVANIEKKMPKNYISADGYHITKACRKYMAPLIHGEDFPSYENGIPQYTSFKNKKVKKIKI